MEYVIARIIIYFLGRLPRKAVIALARFAGKILWLIPSIRSIVESNLRVVFPEMDEKERCRIGKTSLFNTAYNVLEFFWIKIQDTYNHLRYNHQGVVLL